MKKLFPYASALLLAALIAQPPVAHAQGTAFTYQGRLNNGTNPATGKYDITFTLFNVPSGAGQVGNTFTNTATGVTNGLFNATVDFGSVFDGTGYWLEIGVRTNGNGAFTTLSQRQKVTPTPYAVYAETVNAAGISGTVPGGSLGGVYGSPVTLNNAANNFTGNGSGLTNVNAVTVGGQAAGNFWNTSGNSGTTAGVNFIGTTDNQALDLRVHGVRAFRLVPQANGLPNVIGGESGNAVNSGYADVVGGGNGNQISDNYSVIAGGSFNQILAGAQHSAIGGGEFNVIHTYDSTISGGNGNQISDNASVIGGGVNNQILAGASAATIGGGNVNVASGFLSSILGGRNNLASGDSSVAVGGYGNQATGADSFVGGGGVAASALNNVASGLASVIVGGAINVNSGNYGFIGGGSSNNLSGYNAVIGGGEGNAASGVGSVVAGGGRDGYGFSQGNTASGSVSVVGGGLGNTASGYASVVGGGHLNTNSAYFGTIGGGYGNIASGGGSVVGGGGSDGFLFTIGNTASGPASVIGGGLGNTASGVGAVIGGGGYDGLFTLSANTASGGASVIGGGMGNINNGNAAAIGGGYNNQVAVGADHATIGGGNSNLILTNSYSSTIAGGENNMIQSNNTYSTVGGGKVNQILGGASFSTLAGGQENQVQSGALAATIGGGAWNTNTGSFGTIPGGVLNVATNYAFAAGNQAKAVNTGAFVWADSQSADFSSTADNQFAVRAGGGVKLNLGTGNLEIASGGLKVTGAGVGTGTPVFIQRAIAANIINNYTVITNSFCDGNPNAILIVTPNWNPGGSGGTYNSHPIGVFYTGSNWAIFNQDSAAMPVNAAFNVLVVKP